MKPVQPLLLISSIACLSSCATYQPPPIEGNAVLDFSLASDVFGFNLFENGSDCSEKWPFFGNAGPQGQNKKLVVKAGKPIALDLLWLALEAKPATRCNVLFSFVPRPNERYTVTTHYDNELCSVTLSTPTMSARETMRAVQAQRLTFPGAGVSQSYKCVPQ